MLLFQLYRDVVRSRVVVVSALLVVWGGRGGPEEREKSRVEGYLYAGGWQTPASPGWVECGEPQGQRPGRSPLLGSVAAG